MVVGTCLTLAEVRQLADKTSVSVASKNDYDIHQLAVECAADKQHPLTQRLQKILDRKYALQIKRFRAAKSPVELIDLWNDGWTSGHVPGSLWALITHPSANRAAIVEVFGQVHMMSHMAGASTCADRGRLQEQDRKIETLSNDLKLIRARYSDTNQSLAELKQLLENEQANCRKLKAQTEKAGKLLHEYPTQSVVKSATANGLINELRSKICELQQCVEQERTQNQRQSKDLDRLERLLAVSLSNKKASDAATLNLCGQCILYLGGKAGQRRHFQALVESCDGRFLYHDGGRETCPHRISELVSQADVVMCPTDCISHGAMEKARALCAKQDKPIVFMQRASLSTFARSLQNAFG